MDMMATMYASVSYDGKDIYDLSDFTEKTVIPYFEQQEGVARVSDTGIVEKTVEVRLDQDKIDAVNDKILLQTNDKLADATLQLNEAVAQRAAYQSEVTSLQASQNA